MTKIELLFVSFQQPLVPIVQLASFMMFFGPPVSQSTDVWGGGALDSEDLDLLRVMPTGTTTQTILCQNNKYCFKTVR